MMSDQHVDLDETAADERPSVRKALYALVALFVVCCAVVVFAIMALSSRIDSVKATTADRLLDKYGITAKVPSDRHDGATVWTVDGVERNCTWDGKTVTLKCLDGDGVYTEIEKR